MLSIKAAPPNEATATAPYAKTPAIANADKPPSNIYHCPTPLRLGRLGGVTLIELTVFLTAVAACLMQLSPANGLRLHKPVGSTWFNGLSVA